MHGILLPPALEQTCAVFGIAVIKNYQALEPIDAKVSKTRFVARTTRPKSVRRRDRPGRLAKECDGCHAQRRLDR